MKIVFYILFLCAIVLFTDIGCTSIKKVEYRPDGTIIETKSYSRTSPVFELRKMVEAEGIYNRRLEIDYKEIAIQGSVDLSGFLPISAAPGAWFGFKGYHIETGNSNFSK